MSPSKVPIGAARLRNDIRRRYPGTMSPQTELSEKKVATMSLADLPSSTPRNQRKGVLLAFEGLDQSGKETVTSILAKMLYEIGVETERISFPDYETPIGKEIKAFLEKHRDYSPETRHLLFAANRWERRQQIVEWLSRSLVVLADRYSASGIVYGVAHDVDREWLENLEKGLPKADRTFVIDIPVELSFARKVRNRDAYEEQNSLLERVRKMYIELASRYDWIVLDGRMDAESVSREVFSVISQILRSQGKLE